MADLNPSLNAAQTKYKIVFLGDMIVGKTSIINQFIYGLFYNEFQPTIGIEFLSKTMYLDDRIIRLQIWDIGGQQRLRSIISSYIRDSSAAVVVYDISNRQSFLNLENWIEEVRTERGQDVVIMMVGNKTDLAEMRYLLVSVVSQEEGDNKARDLNVKHITVSAKQGLTVETLFVNLSQELPGIKNVPLARNSECNFHSVGGASDNIKLNQVGTGAKKTEYCKC